MATYEQVHQLQQLPRRAAEIHGDVIALQERVGRGELPEPAAPRCGLYDPDEVDEIPRGGNFLPEGPRMRHGRRGRTYGPSIPPRAGEREYERPGEFLSKRTVRIV